MENVPAAVHKQGNNDTDVDVKEVSSNAFAETSGDEGAEDGNSDEDRGHGPRGKVKKEASGPDHEGWRGHTCSGGGG